MPPELQALLPCSSGRARHSLHLDFYRRSLAPSESSSPAQTQLNVWLGLLHPNLLALANLVTAHVVLRFPGCMKTM